MPRYRNRQTGEMIDANSPEEAKQIFRARSSRANNSTSLPPINNSPTSIRNNNVGNGSEGLGDDEGGFERKFLNRLVGDKASYYLTEPLLPKLHIADSPLPDRQPLDNHTPDWLKGTADTLYSGARAVTSPDWLYENVVRQSTSPVGAVENYVGGKALGALGKGIVRAGARVLGKGGELVPGAVEAIAEGSRKVSVKKQIEAAAQASGSKKLIKAAEPPKTLMQKVAELNNELKGIYLSSGIPGTNINIHGITLAARHALSTPLKEGGVIKGGLEAGRMLLSQKAARKKLASFGEEQIKDALEHGALVDPGSLGRQIEKRTLHKIPGVKQIVQLQEDLFEKPLFDEFAPALKMTRYTKEAARLLKTPEFTARAKELGESNLKSAVNKYGEEQAKTLNKTAIQAMKVKADRLGLEQATKEFKQKAASVATDLYGGYGKISKNPTMNTIARVTLLAPDFYKTHVNLMGRLVKGIGQDAARVVGKGAGASVDNKIYRTLAANTAVVTTALDVLNKHMSGKHLWENDNGHEMSLNTGVKDSMGRNVYVRVFGGAEDLPRLIATMAHSVKQNIDSGLDEESAFEDAKKFLMNRLSPIFKPIAQLADNSDYKGEAYYGKKPYAVRVSVPGYGKKTIREGYSLGHTLGKLAGDYSQVASPQALQPLIDSAVQSLIGSGPKVPASREQTKSQIMELPLSFKMPYSGIRDVAKRKILTPEERKAKLLEQRRYQKLAKEQIQREAR